MQKNTKNSIADRKWRTMRVIKSDITQNSTGYQGDTGFDCAIWDMQGFCLVRTNETLTGYEIQIQDFRDDEEEPEEMILDEMGMFRIYEDSDPVYVLMLHGTADGMELAGRMGASQLRNLLYVYKERMDKNRFIQNLLLDNLLLVDIYNQAKKMKIPAELKRVVFVIEPKNEGDVLVQETLKVCMRREQRIS